MPWLELHQRLELYKPCSTGFHKICRDWVLVIPVSFCNQKEVCDDEASADDFNDKEVDEDYVQEVEFLPNQEQLEQND